jgi:hypothetical protein
MYLKPAWNKITAITATALKPSISGLNPMLQFPPAVEDCVTLISLKLYEAIIQISHLT